MDENDLKPLAGPDGKAVEPKPAREIATLEKPESGDRDYRCTVMWTGGAFLLDVDIRPPWNGVDADRASDARLGSVTPLDFGPGATGWIVNHDRVRLYVSCDFQGTQPDTGRAAPPYVGVQVSGDHIDGTSPAGVGQAYADIALKVGRAAATAYECRNTVQLPAAAPRVPS
ncbi:MULTISPECIES: hypothetical protein [unclassified Kitasatospora]|uniref:hypothetical protein n=1 Tax=unclassified Kitasatospora TaxID=2633591 RepID=UPI0033F4147D